MTPEYYKDSKTYGHDDLCMGENDAIYRANCTMLAMQGIPPNKDTIGNFWIEEEKEISPEYIDGQELVIVAEDQGNAWKKLFSRIPWHSGP